MGLAAAPVAFLALLYFPFLDLPKFGVNIDVHVKCDKRVQEETESNSGLSAASESEDETESEVEVPEVSKRDIWVNKVMETAREQGLSMLDAMKMVPESKEEDDDDIQYPHIYESIFAGVQPTLLDRTHKLLDILEHRQLTPEEELEYADVIESREKMKKENEEWMNARAEAYSTKLAPSESSAPASDETHPAS